MSSSSQSRPVDALVVDDDPLIRACLSRLLESVGLVVAAAGDGRQALDLLRGAGARPALVLTDLEMPVLGGRQLVAELRRTPELASLPVIVLSGSPERCPGATLQLPKPFDIDEVLHAVAVLAPRRSLAS